MKFKKFFMYLELSACSSALLHIGISNIIKYLTCLALW